MLSSDQIDQITTDSINSLIPSLRLGVRGWVEDMKARGVFPYIYCGFRSEEKQAELYAKYQAGGPLAAPPGHSYHEAGCAVDWVPVKPMSGNPGFFEADWDNSVSYKIGERVASAHGLTPISVETGHLQDVRYSTVEEAKSAYEQVFWSMG